MSLGGLGKFPFRFGGGKSARQVARDAMLVALSPSTGIGYDTQDLQLRIEVSAHAGVVSNIWRVNGRVALSQLPATMLESLPEAEVSYGLRPTPQQSDNERRNAVAGKKRGANGNALGDIEDACRAICGPQFVALHTTPADQRWAFFELNPGPPAFTYCSSDPWISIQLTKDGLHDDATFFRMRAAVENLLAAMLPASHHFAVVTGDGFYADISLVDEAGV